MESFEGIVEFIAVADNQGFSAAAKHLGCSTSHVSRQLAKLEERLGCKLVARSTRKVSLSDSGRVYYQHCKNLLQGLQEANEELNQEHVRLDGTLRVSAAGGFAESFVAPALMEFAKLHPRLSIDIDFNSRMVNFVEEGFDFAVRYGELNDSSLVARKLIDRPMVAAASPEYLEKNGTPQQPSDLKKHHCLLTNSDSWKFTEAGTAISVKVKGRWRSNNTNAVLRACEMGLGVAYMPRSSFSDAIKQGRLQEILSPYVAQAASSWLVYPNRKFVPLRARLAMDYLVQHFSIGGQTPGQTRV